MRNALRIYWRDLGRIARTPATWIIVFGLTFLPALYSWVNIYGFWNPYQHTDKLSVAVANCDQDASSDLTGTVNLGNAIVEALNSNDQLGWTFTSEDDALDQVKSGKSYAAFVIPADFSSDLLTILTDDFQQPSLEYYVNEKQGAVAPRITGTGATTVDTEINSEFVATVSKVVADKLSSAVADANGKLDTANANATNALHTASSKIGDAQTKLDQLSQNISGERSEVRNVHGTIDQLSQQADSLGASLDDVITQAGATQQAVMNFSMSLTSPMLASLQKVNTATSTASVAMGTVQTNYAELNTQVGLGLGNAQSVLDTEQGIIDQINASGLANDPAVQQQLQKLTDRHTQSQQNLDALKNQQNNITTTVNDTTTMVRNLSDDTQKATGSLGTLTTTLSGSSLPTIGSGFTSLNSALATMVSTASQQKQIVTQVGSLLDQLDDTLGQLQDLLSSTKDSLGTLRTSLDGAATDAGLLAQTQTWQNILKATQLDSTKISDFMSSPTQIETERLYPVNNYGSSMAPMFTALTMWIGCLALVILFRLDADDEGIENMTARQSYIGRYLLLGTMSVIQALIVSIGEIVMGVQLASPALLVVSTILVGLVFLSLIYTLSVCFTHIGIGVAMLLAFIQIPGTSGLYPIEMMPSFFQRLYPMLPFTYAINMFRECIAGFYGSLYWSNLALLLVFAVISFAFGLLVRPVMTNLTRVFNKEALDTHLMVAEQTPTVARRYRLDQMMRALGANDEYRRQIMLRAARYEVRYPRLQRGALVAGIIIPSLLTVLSAYNSHNKPLILALWVLWMAIIIVFLLAIELVRDSYQRQMLLLNVAPDELRHMVATNSSTLFGRVSATIDPRHGSGARNDGAASGGAAANAAAQATAYDVPVTQAAAPTHYVPGTDIPVRDDEPTQQIDISPETIALAQTIQDSQDTPTGGATAAALTKLNDAIVTRIDARAEARDRQLTDQLIQRFTTDGTQTPAPQAPAQPQPTPQTPPQPDGGGTRAGDVIADNSDGTANTTGTDPKREA
ncbi:ABC transporter [Pseudoscardovia radai]|uniref:ABC transporter n=1 Tax=Pseudoscardovia radai TaxID=987066 RepID=A0A261EVY9_9BIFI|nr:YhgE/Pip domain-containing protein [Pseudoscardovia radai]OZG51031.1 ABC transporter [Pseudoscardovia radai]